MGYCLHFSLYSSMDFFRSTSLENVTHIASMFTSSQFFTDINKPMVYFPIPVLSALAFLLLSIELLTNFNGKILAKKTKTV